MPLVKRVTPFVILKHDPKYSFSCSKWRVTTNYLLLFIESDALLRRIANGEIDQGSPELITYLRTLILPPSKEPYNIETQVKDTSMGQAAMVNKILNEKVSEAFK